MKYAEVVLATFIKRVNRFIAHVQVDEKEVVVHVKNTGRCKELLVPGVRVVLEKASNPARKTGFSLVAVYKGDLLINMDSQAPNQVVYEALLDGKINEIGAVHSGKREVTFGKSRFDMAFEREGGTGWMEVKGVTLENQGVVLFPDAPTQRGTKHIYEMITAVKQGYDGFLFFLIQMKGVRYFTPNREMDSDFAEALTLAARQGVRILAYDAVVSENGLELGEPVEVKI